MLYILFDITALALNGSRCGNMDYVFGAALSHFVGLLMFVIGYDIVCHWFVRLFSISVRGCHYIDQHMDQHMDWIRRTLGTIHGG